VGVNTAVAGLGLGLAGPVNPTTLPIVSALMRGGRLPRAVLRLPRGGRAPPPPPAPPPRPRGRRAGARAAGGRRAPARGGPPAGDLLLDVDGQPVAAVGALQRLMVTDVIDRAIAIRVGRRGELLSLSATPVELAS